MEEEEEEEMEKEEEASVQCKYLVDLLGPRHPCVQPSTSFLSSLSRTLSTLLSSIGFLDLCTRPVPRLSTLPTLRLRSRSSHQDRRTRWEYTCLAYILSAMFPSSTYPRCYVPTRSK